VAELTSSNFLAAVSAKVPSPPPRDLRICTELRLTDASGVHVSQIWMSEGSIVWYAGERRSPDITIALSVADAQAISLDASPKTGLDAFKAGRISLSDPKNLLGYVLQYCMPRVGEAVRAARASRPQTSAS
jgi:hypothetical protein